MRGYWIFMTVLFIAMAASSYANDIGKTRAACATDCLAKGFNPTDCKELCE